VSLRSLTGLLAAGLLAVPALAAGPDFEAVQIQPYRPPKPAPAFALPTLDGHVRSLAESRGKVVLLFFWATW
jgi:hypothetical protein